MDPLCRLCGLSVNGGSMGGPDVCPACDCGYFRDHTPWTFWDSVHAGNDAFKAKAADAVERLELARKALARKPTEAEIIEGGVRFLMDTSFGGE